MKKMFVLLAMVLAGMISVEADVTWDGSESGDWNNPDNWEGGLIPTSSDNVFLTDSGVAPTNQNIVGLSVKKLWACSRSIDVVGEPFSIENFEFSLDSNQTFTVWQDITRTTTSSWSGRAGCKIVLRGNIYEADGVSCRLRIYNGAQIDLYGTNYCTDGVEGYQGTVTLYQGEKGLSPEPDVFDSNAIKANYGAVSLKSPKTGCYDIDTGENRGIDGGNSALILGDRDIRLLINSDITSSKVAFGSYGGEDGGEFWLNNTNMIKGYAGLSGGLVYCNSTNVVQETPGNTTTWSIGTGSIDLNGNDVLNRDISYSNNSGPYGAGGILNSNTNKASTIDGDFTQLGTGAGALNFGGNGEVVLEGNVGSASAWAALQKGGNGTLRLKGTTTSTKTTLINGGSLILDYSDNTSAKIPATQELRLYSSDLVIEPNASSAITVDIATLYGQDDPGFSSVSIASSAGATADIDIEDFDLHNRIGLDMSVEDGGAGMPTISTSELDGSMQPSFTFNKNKLAMVSSGEVVAETDYTDVADNTTFESITTIDNLNITASFTAGTPGASARTLRFAGSYILNLTQTLWLSDDPDHDGGVSSILIPEGTGDVEIHGGALDTGLNASTHVFNYDADSILTLGSRLGGTASAGDSWYFIGPGKVIVTNTQNNISGFHIDNDVTLEFADFAALGIGSTMSSSGGTLRYVGAGEADGTTIKLYQSTTLDASGSGELEFTETGNAVTTAYGNYNNLTLTGSGDGSFAGNLKLYMGSVVKKGSGTWTLSAVQDYVGKTEILGGELAIEESVERDVYVGENGTLSGSPAIGRDFETEGTVVVDLSAGKTMTVGCTATLGGTLEFEGELVQGEEFVLIEATTIVGSFENTPERYDVVVSGNEVLITLAPPQGTLLIVQ